MISQNFLSGIPAKNAKHGANHEEIILIFKSTEVTKLKGKLRKCFKLEEMKHIRQLHITLVYTV